LQICVSPSPSLSVSPAHWNGGAITWLLFKHARYYSILSSLQILFFIFHILVRGLVYDLSFLYYVFLYVACRILHIAYSANVYLHPYPFILCSLFIVCIFTFGGICLPSCP
jgi:hypothetical protein